jgi:hypothetical protein
MEPAFSGHAGSIGSQQKIPGNQSLYPPHPQTNIRFAQKTPDSL